MRSEVGKRLGRRVAAYRKTARLSQPALASRVGVASETISRLERGSHLPSIERMDDIASALGVELRDLFDFEESRSSKDAAIDTLVRFLRRRVEADIALVYDLARRIFEGSTDKRERKRFRSR